MNEQWKQIQNTRDPDEMLKELLGDRFEEYRRRWCRAGNLELVQDYPIHLDFELQYGCNLRCPYCILQVDPDELPACHPYRKENRSKKISFELFKKVIDEGVKHGLSSITVGVNNEPLLMKDIAKYIRYAREKGVIDIIMLTNATLLDQECAGKLLESGLTKLFFSIDAIREETYKKLRVNGDFGKVMNNINGFLEAKARMRKDLPVTRVSYVKCKANEAETEEFTRYWERKVDFVCVQAFMTPAFGYSNYEAVKETFQLANEEIKECGPCPQPYQRLVIYHDGSVHPCCHWYGATMILGNIASDSIYEIWNSKKMKDLRVAVNAKDPDVVPQECRICKKMVFG